MSNMNSTSPPTVTEALERSSTPDPKPRPKEARLLSSIEDLNSKIASTESQLSVKMQDLKGLKSFQHGKDAATDDSNDADMDKAALSHAQSITTKHVSLLTRYNEIKDVALGMLSLIADKEGRRLAEVMDERGVSEKD